MSADLQEGQKPRLPETDTERPIVQPRLGPIGWLRWMWRQLTSMRTALILLMLLALAAVPGSLIPQTRIDPAQVTGFIEEHPTLAPWVNRFDGFDVYGSPWFSAIYLLLFISLIGCVVPRTRQQFKALLAKPPRAPRRLERMPVHGRAETSAAPEEVLEAARKALRRRRYRVHAHDGQTLSADRGMLSETGNLLFHLSLVGLLAAMAIGSFVSYSGQNLVIVGEKWANTLPQYDTFQAGRNVGADDLPPYSFTLKSFTADFESQAGGSQFGAARDFEAKVDLVTEPGADPQERSIRVNQPLDVNGARLFLVGNGYAPEITVRDGEGNEVWSGPVAFLSNDSNYTSTGVIKLPAAKPRQLGLMGVFLPTAGTDPATGAEISVFPAADNPRLQVLAFTGDLGLDDGVGRSVYVLDPEGLTPVKNAEGEQFSKTIGVGESVELPGGNGTVTLDGVTRYVALDIRYDPTKPYVLVFALMALFGVTASLFVRRRRVWFRVTPGADGLTVVGVGGLSRTEDTQLADEVRSLLTAAVPARVEESPATSTDTAATEPRADREPDAPSEKPADTAGEGV
ncbi:cytochrome c biogenesis protein ResB [Kineosporia rhizophila]|uniref:cytochrome c biogenesis protein ResB n=1 Tax=Kineosporia TaxID=49184 RepID=UPI001E63427C|nr:MULTISPECIES: cytochrome c biogenesis protein ResB [Kineosporia]MCE0540092.1 cytochrome c biogenesis protein ResB [Kineosporia rhizophila]GLY13300.1 cytochrome c biogenesis protein ResB [Kineosporia sp. NBRC 101677]